MSEPGNSDELKRLSFAVEELGRRVSIMESILARGEASGIEPSTPEEAEPADEAAPTPTKGGETEAGDGASKLFVRAAVVCLCLIGALVMRLITRQGVVGTIPGALAGLGYCASLIIGPHVRQNFRSISIQGSLLQYCGVLLTPLIVLETHFKSGAFNVQSASLILLGLGAMAAVVGGRSGQKYLVGLALCVSGASLTILGKDMETFPVRTLSMVGLCGIAATVSSIRDWKFLKPLTFLPSFLLIGLAILMTAHRDSLPESIPLYTLAAAGTLFLIIALHHALRLTTLTLGESIWLPIGSLWISLLLIFFDPWIGAVTASTGGLTMALTTIILTKRDANISNGVAWMGVAGALAATVGFGRLDPTAVSIGIFGVLTLLAARRFESSLWGAISHLQILAATVIASTAGGLAFTSEPHGILAPMAGFGLSGLAFATYFIAISNSQKRRSPLKWSWISSTSLFSGSLALFLSGRVQAHMILGNSPSYSVILTFLLSVMSVVCLILSKRLARRTLKGAGILCVILLTGKVLLLDTLSLSPAYSMASLCLLAIVYVVFSIQFRTKSKVVKESEKEESDP